MYHFMQWAHIHINALSFWSLGYTPDEKPFDSQVQIGFFQSNSWITSLNNILSGGIAANSMLKSYNFLSTMAVVSVSLPPTDKLKLS